MIFPKTRVKWAIIALFLTITGCSNIPDSKEVSYARIQENKENLTKLKIGMNRDRVLEIMGRPQDTAPGPRQAQHLVYWLYQTYSRDLTSWALNSSFFTWLAFDGEELVAVGAGHEVIPFNKNHPLWRSQ